MSTPKSKVNRTVKVKKEKKKVQVKANPQEGKTGPALIRQRQRQRAQGNIARGKPGFVSPLLITTENKSTLGVRCEFSTLALKEAICAFTSYFYQQGILDNLETQSVSGGVWQMFYGGMNYMASSVAKQIQGTVIETDQVPAVIDCFINALVAKTQTFHKYGKVSYGWTDFDTAIDFRTYALSYATWNQTRVNGDTQTYDSPAILISSPIDGDPNLYSNFLQQIQGLSYTKLFPKGPMALQTVKLGATDMLKRDVSAFARVYPYNGLNPSLSGAAWNSVELETPISAPMMARFCPYTVSQPDMRSGRHYDPTAGGPAYTLGLPLSPVFNSFFNKIPYTLKQVDLNDIVYRLAFWAAKAKEKMRQNGNDNDGTYTAPFTFSYQDFVIVIRQALLSAVFTEQYMTQFTGYVNHDNGNNTFAPVLVQGHTYGAQVFTNLLVPELLRENLGALRSRNYDFGAKSNLNIGTVIPVLGIYIEDTPPVFQYNGSGEGPVNLFTTFDPPQTAINIIDGSIAGALVNLNGLYYQQIVNDWNDFVTGVSAVTCNTASIRSDGGPQGLGVLHLTRMVELQSQSGPDVSANRNRRGPAAYRYIKNLPTGYGTIEPVVDKRKSMPKAIPPATASQLATKCFLNQFPFKPELMNLYNFMVLPVIRRSEPAEDVLTISQYCIEVGEPISVQNLGIPGGGEMLSRAEEFAAMCVPGLAREAGSTYVEIMNHLATMGKSGILASLLGGIAKNIFPSASGVIDTVASFVPI
jgi:hypothetical protein